MGRPCPLEMWGRVNKFLQKKGGRRGDQRAAEKGSKAEGRRTHKAPWRAVEVEGKRAGVVMQTKEAGNTPPKKSEGVNPGQQAQRGRETPDRGKKKRGG